MDNGSSSQAKPGQIVPVDDPTKIIMAALPQPRRRKRRAVTAPPPPAPPHLQKQVAKRAKVLERHRRVLGDLGMQAVQTATLQVVAQQLADIQALLRANGVVSMSIPVVSAGAPAGAPPHAPAGPTCALCGRLGVYQSKTAQVPRGRQRPWYCAGDHANWAASEDGQQQITSRLVPPTQPMNTNAPVAAVPDGGASSISGAMAALLGDG